MARTVLTLPPILPVNLSVRYSLPLRSVLDLALGEGAGEDVGGLALGLGGVLGDGGVGGHVGKSFVSDRHAFAMPEGFLFVRP